MPIRPFLNGNNSIRKTVRILGVAFEQVCIGLRTGDCDDDVKQAIANKIIVVARLASATPTYSAKRYSTTFVGRRRR